MKKEMYVAPELEVLEVMVELYLELVLQVELVILVVKVLQMVQMEPVDF